MTINTVDVHDDDDDDDDEPCGRLAPLFRVVACIVFVTIAGVVIFIIAGVDILSIMSTSSCPSSFSLS